MPSHNDVALRRQTPTHIRSSEETAHQHPWPIGYVSEVSDLESALRRPALARMTDHRGAAAMGRIVFTPDGRPIRTIITGRRHIVTGSYASRKAGRAMPFESMIEQQFFMHSEVDTGVADYRAQPFRFEFTLDGAKRTYIVDCVRLLSDGRIEVVEVKNDRRALRDEAYAQKLERVAEICSRLNWQFRVVYREELDEPPTRNANILEIQSRRHARFSDADVYVALDLIERLGGQAPLGLLAEKLGDRIRGAAAIQAMMVQRLVEIDLIAPLGADSAVCIPSRSAAQKRESDR